MTASRRVFIPKIYNLVADTDYEVQVAVCRVWDGVRGECSVAPSPAVSVRTGEKTTMVWIIMVSFS